ncbi:MAG: hypothetical protein V3U20_01960 [Thermoplasmata archaeon]
MYGKWFRKLYTLVVMMMGILSPQTSIFLWDEMEFAQMKDLLNSSHQKIVNNEPNKPLKEGENHEG